MGWDGFEILKNAGPGLKYRKSHAHGGRGGHLPPPYGPEKCYWSAIFGRLIRNFDVKASF